MDEPSSTEYQCPRCHYTSNFKNNIRSHYRRKKPCTPTFDDTPPQQLLIQLSIVDVNVHRFHCAKCDKRYSSRQGLYLHDKNCNPQQQQQPNDQNSELMERIRELENLIKQNATGASTSGGNTNHTNNTLNHSNNITININMAPNNFGDENMSHVTEELKKECLNTLNAGFMRLLEDVHFNKDVPENWNVVFKSEDKLWVRRGSMWLEADTRTLTNEMMQKLHQLLNHYYNAHYHESDEGAQQKILTWLLGISNESSIDYFTLRRNIPITVKNQTRLMNLQTIHNVPSIPQLV